MRIVGDLWQSKSSARKYHESLHFVFECGWCELTSADCPDRIDPDTDSDAA